MKRKLSVLLALTLSASMFISGCSMQSIDFIVKGSSGETASSEVVSSDEDEIIYQIPEDQGIVSSSVEEVFESAPCPLSEKKIEKIAKNCDDTIAQYPDFSGTVLLASGNRIIYEKSYGKTGIKNGQNENDTLYQIGSVTKQFTGLAVMQLVREGKLKTTDTIDKYFPEYGKYDFLKNITVEHLLEMSSGMGDYMELIEGDEDTLKGYLKAAAQSEDAAKKFIVKTIFEEGVFADPGTTYVYSNSAYYLLGLIIEQLSGMSYRDYLQTNFFDKANMTDTYFVGDGKDCCTGYSLAELKYVSDKDTKELKAEGDYPYLFSAGSVVSTVEDVDKWLALVTSDELFSPIDRKTVEKSLMHYNYGWNTSDDLWHHSGRTYAYSSQVYADYRTDTRLVILTNVAFYGELNELALKMYLPLVNEVKQSKY